MKLCKLMVNNAIHFLTVSNRTTSKFNDKHLLNFEEKVLTKKIKISL